MWRPALPPPFIMAGGDSGTIIIVVARSAAHDFLYTECDDCSIGHIMGRRRGLVKYKGGRAVGSK